MKSPSKALVLAAGHGTRMLPLTAQRPKPLMPLWGRTLLDHCLDLLSRWGVTDVLVNTHHLAGAIEEHMATHPRQDLHVRLSHEATILGTAGAVANARGFLDASPFWIINADVAAELDPSSLLAHFDNHDCLAVLWMHDRRGPRTVRMREHRIEDFTCLTPGMPETYTFCGLQLVDPSLLRYIPPGQFSTLVAAYSDAMSAGHEVHGVCVPGAYWNDVGTPERYLATHEELLRASKTGSPGGTLVDPRRTQDAGDLQTRGVTVTGFACLQPGVRVAAGTSLENCVLWEGVTVMNHARVADAIAGPGAVLCGTVTGIVVTPNSPGIPPLRKALEDLAWDAERTSVLPLAQRGSDRSFYRLQSGEKSMIAIHYGRARAENALFASNARFLAKAGIPVPEVLWDRPARRLTLVSDLGNRSLGDVVAEAEGETTVRLHYARVLDAVATLHRIGPRQLDASGPDLCEPFSEDLLRWEREYFARHFLGRYPELDPALDRAALREIEESTASLLGEPKSLVHRDLQSSNVLVKADGTPWLIDFQGMRLGPAAYDVASLICDPYVSLGHEVQHFLLGYYDERAPHPVASMFWVGALQRLVQALGAFSKLGAMYGTRRFASHILPAIRMLQRVLKHLDKHSHLFELLCYAASQEETEE